MRHGERAQALAAKQKAERKALKQRRKESTNPQDWGRWRQMREAYKMAVEYDKPLPWILLACGLGTLAVFIGLGFLIKAPIIMTILGISVALIVVMLVFARRFRNVTYQRFEGKTGSAEFALQQLPKQWVYEPVITAAPNRGDLALVHRALGPGGLFLIGEGDPLALKRIMKSEAIKHKQVHYGVDVNVVYMGDGEGQVPLRELTKYLRKQPKKLSDSQISQVKTRLQALDSQRQKLPIPRGHISMKGARRAMRGR